MDDVFAQNRARFRREQDHIVRANRTAQEQARQSRAAPANVCPEEWNAYLQWAREHIGGSEAAIRAAAQAVIEVKAAGSSDKNAAITAARDAARRAEAKPQRPSPAPPGKIVGIARGVKPNTQFMSGFQILDFELEPPDGPPLRVQVRGKMINGRLDNGDEVMVDKPPDGSRFLQTDRVINLSWNSTVEAPKDSFFETPFIKAMSGEKVARIHRRIRVGALVYAVVFVLFLMVFGIFLGYQFVNSNDHEPPTPTWVCEQAKKTGIENPPGC